MKKLILVLVVAGVATAGVFLYNSNQPAKIVAPEPMPSTGEVRAVHVAQMFYDGLPEDYAVVDVRTVQEYEKAHTRGTINIPVALFEDSDDPCKEIVAKLPKDKKIIFICPYGPRSKEMYQNLTDPVEDLGCGMEKEGMYHLWDRVRFKKDKLIIQQLKG